MGQEVEGPVGPKPCLGSLQRDEDAHQEAEQGKHQEEAEHDAGGLTGAVKWGLPADAAILKVSWVLALEELISAAIQEGTACKVLCTRTMVAQSISFAAAERITMQPHKARTTKKARKPLNSEKKTQRRFN